MHVNEFTFQELMHVEEFALLQKLMRERYLPPLATEETEARRGLRKTFQYRH